MGKCIESILSQEFTNFELILVDDGSTDNSSLICKYSAENNAQVTYIRQNNKGVSSARNRGLELSKGDYITFVDSDDMIKPFYLSTLEYYAKNNEADIISFGTELVKERKVISTNSMPYFVSKGKDDFKSFFQEYYSVIMGSMCNKAYKKEMLLKYAIFVDETISLNEDILFDFVAVAKAQKIINIEEILYQYNQNQNSSSRKGRKDILEIFEIKKRRMLFFLNEMGYEDFTYLIADEIKIYVFIQFLQAALSDTNFSFFDRTEILKKLYQVKEYRDFIIAELKNQGKSLGVFLSYLSVKTTIPFFVAMPAIIKKKASKQIQYLLEKREI